MGQGKKSDSPAPPKTAGSKKDDSMNQYQLRKKLYSDPPKQALEAARDAMKRLKQAKQQETGGRSQSAMSRTSAEEAAIEREHERQLDLIGELKAAEARNRLRVVRLRYEANRTQEINHLVSSQATALEAVRLKVILPTTGSAGGHHDRLQQRDPLGKLERQRVERLVELPIEHFIRRP